MSPPQHRRNSLSSARGYALAIAFEGVGKPVAGVIDNGIHMAIFVDFGFEEGVGVCVLDYVELDGWRRQISSRG